MIKLRSYQVTDWFLPLLAIMALVCCSAVVNAQNGGATADTLTGRYEGLAKMGGPADVKFTLELKNDGGKVTGHVVTSDATFDITEGTFVESKLTLKIAGHDGSLIAKVDGDKITGDFVGTDHKFPVELKKVATSSAATTTTDSSLTGDWDGVADADGQPFNFTLTLHIEGEKVTGSSSSQLGTSTVNGTWKDGKLVFQLDGGGGTVSMTATVVDGKLTGQFDYAGQMQGKWVAVKKK